MVESPGLRIIEHTNSTLDSCGNGGLKLSKKLVTITTDCKFDFNYLDCNIKTPNFKKLNDIFDELEFNLFKEKLSLFNKESTLSLF